jgi:hypothetical protein
MNPPKTARNSAKPRIIAPKYLKVQFGGSAPRNYHPFWVTAQFITRTTGWDRNILRSARERGFINYREDERGELLYDYNSLPDRMIKQHA